jgi:hypothetical protein
LKVDSGTLIIDVDGSSSANAIFVLSNDDVIIGGALDHAGALNVIAHGAEDGTGTTGAGLLYSSADKVVTSAGVLTLRGDVIGKSDNASDPLKVASTSLNLNAGASGNGAVNVTSASAIRLDTLDTTGTGAVAITTTAGNIQLGNGSGTAINNAGTGALTVTSAGNIDVTEAFTQTGDATLVSATAGRIFGDSLLSATGALTLRTDMIDNDGDSSDGDAVGSKELKVDSGTLIIDVDGSSSANAIFVLSNDAISLTDIKSAGTRTIAISTGNSDTADHITIGGAINSDATGSLTLTSNDDVIIGEALDHAGALNIIAHGAENGTTTTGAGLLYSSADKIVTSGAALTLRGDVIGKTDNASAALKVSSTSLNLNAGTSGNGAINITSAAAIRLDTLDSTGSGTVGIATTSGDITLGNGSGAAIDNTGAARGALTVTSVANINVNEAFSHQGSVTLTASGAGTKAGKIYGDSVLTSTGAMTLNADLIGDDASATNALAIVSGGALVIDGDAGTAAVKISSTSSITTGSVDIENSGGNLTMTTTGSTSDLTVGAGMLATNVTLTAGRNVILSGEVFAGANVNSSTDNAITIVANGGGSGVGSVTQSTDLSNGWLLMTSV